MTAQVTGRGGPIIAIDGPAGAGKSTVARELARLLDLPHVDTGALYRAVTLAVLRAGVDPDDPAAVEQVARSVRVEHREGRTFLDGEDVEDRIRGSDVTAAVSAVAAHPHVRAELLPVQRTAAAGGAVVEGRDIGAVVFPDAELKIWLTAQEEERARRRAEQEGADDPEAVARDLARRDARDTGRVVAPARKSEDAWEMDTTAMSSEETVAAIADLARAVWARQGRDDLVAAVEGSAADGRAEAVGAPGIAAPQPGSASVPGEGTDVAGTAPPAPAPAIVQSETALPRVAVVGRPNVGKSTFVNRAITRRAAIVEEKPGVTRDRTEHVARWRDRIFLVVDTGGWQHGAEGMDARIVEQAEAAVATADVVVLLVDVTVGALEDDERYARLLRRAEVPVLLVANKVDSPRQDPLVHELYGLGLGEPLPVSAAHGRGMGDVLDAIVSALPDHTPVDEPDGSDVPRVAVVGRPNVGKSSLFNRLAGEERAIVDPVPHTTRDPVDTLVTIDGEPWRFVDTAGLRRRYRHGEETERYAVDRTRRAADRADLSLFVVDGSEPLGEQDQRLAAMVRDAGCGVVLVVNKWDLVDDQRRQDLERELDRLLGFTGWAPRVNVSAHTGRGLERLVPWLARVLEAHRTRIPTGELNAWLQEAVDRASPPPGRGGRVRRPKYVTQVAVGPPTFVVFGAPLEASYRRYLERSLRERYGFVGTPLRVEDRPARRRGRRA